MYQQVFLSRKSQNVFLSSMSQKVVSRTSLIGYLLCASQAYPAAVFVTLYRHVSTFKPHKKKKIDCTGTEQLYKERAYDSYDSGSAALDQWSGGPVT